MTINSRYASTFRLLALLCSLKATKGLTTADEIDNFIIRRLRLV